MEFFKSFHISKTAACRTKKSLILTSLGWKKVYVHLLELLPIVNLMPKMTILKISQYVRLSVEQK